MNFIGQILFDTKHSRSKHVPRAVSAEAEMFGDMLSGIKATGAGLVIRGTTSRIQL